MESSKKAWILASTFGLVGAVGCGVISTVVSAIAVTISDPNDFWFMLADIASGVFTSIMATIGFRCGKGELKTIKEMRQFMWLSTALGASSVAISIGLLFLLAAILGATIEPFDQNLILEIMFGALGGRFAARYYMRSRYATKKVMS